MKKIADGYFYDVYDMGNNRVLKKQRSFTDIAKSIKGKTGMNTVSNWIKTWNYIRSFKKTTEILKQKFTSIPQELIGNPVFYK